MARAVSVPVTSANLWHRCSHSAAEGRSRSSTSESLSPEDILSNDWHCGKPSIHYVKCISWRHPQQWLTSWKTINTLCKAYHLKISPAMTDTMETINTLCKAYLLKTSPATKFYMFICCCLGRPVCFMSQNGDCTHPRRQGTLSDENKTEQSNIVTRWLFDVYFSHKLIFSWMHIRYVRPLFSTEQHCCHEVKIAHFQQTISVLFCAIC